jgi:hypothetical protein
VGAQSRSAVGSAARAVADRYGTELDLGPDAAYGWLAANARRFHFIQRYPQEPFPFSATTPFLRFNVALDGRRGRRSASGGGGGARCVSD